MNRLKTVCAIISFASSSALAIDPELNQPSSYAVDGKCYCESAVDFSNGLADKKVLTPVGELSPQLICEDIKAILGEGPTENRIPFNDIQCGNGPQSDEIAEIDCPGRLDMGIEGCAQVGPSWDLVSVYGAFSTPQPGDAAGDNTPPSANFANLQNGDVLPQGEEFVVEVLAEDEDGISNVILFLDGVFVRQVDTAPFRWDDDVLQNLEPGLYSLIAVAEDNVGLTTEAEAVITIAASATPEPTPVTEPNKKPKLRFVSPQNGDHFRAGEPPLVRVKARDSDGIRHVTLYLDGVFVRRESQAPYLWSSELSRDPMLKNLMPGTYTLVAVAEDNTGLTREKEISFTIGENKDRKNKRKHKKKDKEKCHLSSNVDNVKYTTKARRYRSGKIGK